ncbi:hypothetical protein EV175_003606 [Coemansia sp. RSA 1933]|nr:hypothetical protein EV175_003606 [Coemansia sp. RSA 1933]
MSAPTVATIAQILELAKINKKFVLFYFSKAEHKDADTIKTLKKFLQLVKGKGIPAAQCIISNLDNTHYLGSNYKIGDIMGAAVFKNHEYISTIADIHNGEDRKCTMLTELLDRVEKPKAVAPPPAPKAPAIVNLNTRVLQSAGEVKSAISANQRYLLFYYQGAESKSKGIGALKGFLKAALAHKIPNGQWNDGSDGRSPGHLKSTYGNDDPMGVAMFRGGKYLMTIEDISKGENKLGDFKKYLENYDSLDVMKTPKEIHLAQQAKDEAEKKAKAAQAKKPAEPPAQAKKTAKPAQAAAKQKKPFMDEGARSRARKAQRKEWVQKKVIQGKQVRNRGKTPAAQAAPKKKPVLGEAVRSQARKAKRKEWMQKKVGQGKQAKALTESGDCIIL